jgi:hypothetical protein
MVINMPWDEDATPHSCCEAAQALFQEHGIACEILYADLIAATLFRDQYPLKAFAQTMASELIYNAIYYGRDDDETGRLLSSYLFPYAESTGEARLDYPRLLRLARELLVRIEAETMWRRYRAVVFLVCARQFFSSLCLARLIKQRFPELGVIFIGEGYDASLAGVILKTFTELDAFVPSRPGLDLVRSFEQLANVSGARRASATPKLPRAENHEPRFGDGANGHLKERKLQHQAFLSQRNRLGALQPMTLPLPVPNGTANSAGLSKLVGDLVELSSAHRVSSFVIDDRVLNGDECRRILSPLVALQRQENYQFSLRGSVAPDLMRPEISLLREAGTLEISATLSCLSAGAFERLGQPTRTIEDIQLLKLLAENGINVKWDIFWGAPDEAVEAYDEMTNLIPSILHLSPAGFLPYSVAQRSCAGHRAPHDCSPALARELFTTPGGSQLLVTAFCTLADGDSSSSGRQEPPLLGETRERFNAVLDSWRRTSAPNLLTYSRGPGFVRISDRRTRQTASGETVITLVDKQSEIFLFCEEPRHLEQVIQRFLPQLTAANVEKFLEVLVEHRLFYRSTDNRFLALPIHRKLMRIK